MGYIVGIDPGLTLTGICILSADKALNTYVCFKAAKEGTTFDRVGGLAWSICEFLSKENIEISTIVLEHAIYAKHPLVFAKQIKLLQTIQIFAYDFCDEWSLKRMVEVMPSAPRLVFGLKPNTEKQVITDLFKLDYPHAADALRTKAALSTVADAWSIALCGFKPELWKEEIKVE